MSLPARHALPPLLFLFFLITGLRPLLSAAVPDPGLYAICYGRHNQHLLDLPFTVGGQVCVQWRDLNPAPGQFDFSPIDSRLGALKKATIRPPSGSTATASPTSSSTTSRTTPSRSPFRSATNRAPSSSGTPITPRPIFDLIEAFGKHLDSSPHRDAVLGIRLNFNASGTEHTHIKDEFQFAALRRLRYLLHHAGTAFHVKSVGRPPEREIKPLIDDFQQ